MVSQSLIKMISLSTFLLAPIAMAEEKQPVTENALASKAAEPAVKAEKSTATNATPALAAAPQAGGAAGVPGAASKGLGFLNTPVIVGVAAVSATLAIALQALTDDDKEGSSSTATASN